MSIPAPYQIGQVSPDGMWMWDGQRWIPVQRPGQPVVRRSRGWVWWLAGGCLLLLVVAVGLGIWGATALVHNLQAGNFSCLPSNFPKYPGATVTRDYTYVGTGVAPGDARECQETLDSGSDVAAVTNFYVSQLNSGDWKITSNDTATGQIRFQRVSRPQTVGTVQLLGRGQQTTIEIKLDS